MTPNDEAQARRAYGSRLQDQRQPALPGATGSASNNLRISSGPLCRQTRDDHRRKTLLQPELSSKAVVRDLTATLEAERAGQSGTQNVGLHKQPDSA